jgi:hypothetical protein
VLKTARALLIALLWAGPPSGQEGTLAAERAEYQLKAAFIYRFAQFTEWPASALARSEKLVLCVLGEDPFGNSLHGIEGNTVHERPLSIRYLSDPQQIGECHIAFLGPMKAETANVAIKRSRQYGVLSVSDAAGFAAAGGMIQFVIVNNRVQFEINAAAAERGGLRLSSHLLKLARGLYSSYPD